MTIRTVLRLALVVLLAASIASLVVQGQQNTTGVGDGSPNSAILGLFLQAFGRGSFSTLVALPPTTKVHRDGPGYVQDFDDINPNTGFSYALAKPDTLDAAYQMCCQILAMHKSIGSFSGNIGYPVSDYGPGLQSPIDGTPSLQQNFTGGHVIILHQAGTYNGQAFFIREPYVSRWRVTPALALPIGQERNTTSRFTTTATQQDFQGGVIVRITSGTLQDQVFVVSGTAFTKYGEIGGTASWLGYPVGDEFTISGRQRQNFEGGFIEYVPGSGASAEARAPVSTVRMDVAPVTLQVGNVITRTVEAFDNLGNPVLDRPVIWSTSNRSVVQVQANGATATLRAVGPGFANIVALVDGVSGGTLRITVTSACCQVGEGAPTLAIRQAFQDALTRNSITPRLPADGPVRRLGVGYGQEFSVLTPANLGRVLVLKSDSAPLAYAVAGVTLSRYLELGGPAGPLGFPVSDANAAGRQQFENQSILFGSPPLLVSAPVTQKWTALGFETGAAGPVRGEASAAGPTVFGSYGVAQTFANGVIYGYTSGTRAGQSFFVSGPILARYLRLSGPAGALGFPTSDPADAGGRARQGFEGGVIEFAAGDAEAQERLNARTPAVTAFPAIVPIGGRVRIAITGFTPGRRLAVTLGSTPEFEVTPANGAFGWDQQVRPNTAPGTYRVVVRDPAGGESAETSYRVQTLEEVRFQLTKVSGDNQSALPGSEAAVPLVVRLTDDAGNAIAGARVLFGSVGGGVVTPPDTTTDADGYARARFRLPPASGLALATAEAANRIVTFAARAEDARLGGFPSFRQGLDDVRLGGGPATIHQKGSLLTAVAAIFRYFQDRGELPASNGLAEPAALNQFLLTGGYLPFTLNGRTEQVVNLARALAFVGDAADWEVVAPELPAIRDAVNLRRPVLVGLMLRSGEQDRGAHYVVANGVGSDGAVLIYDPSPDWNRSSLADYAAGFNALGRSWTGRILHALRLRPGTRSPRAFLVHGAGPAPLRLTAPAASQGYNLHIPVLAAFDELVTDNGEVAQLVYTDGRAPQYQLIIGDGTTATVRGPSASGPHGRGVYRITPDPFAVSPQSLTAAADGLRNAAGFGPRLAPGSLASLFGAGLVESLALPPTGPAASLAGLTITAGGRPAPLLFATPYQANLQLPYELPPGVHAVEVTSGFGAARFDVSLDEAAPGIFVLNSGRGAVLNQDGTLNAPLNPAARGSVLQVFVTGLGKVAPSIATGAAAPNSPLSRAVAPLTATLDGRAVEVLFAGLAPGFIGLGQVNLLVTASLPPNPETQLVLQAAGRDSNAVPVAIQ
jgi:uncharacterized protein (TIGR03437 family)